MDKPRIGGRAVLGFVLQQSANVFGRRLCGATDGTFGRCNLPAGHESGGWHLEMRKGEVWAEWRGPDPGERCGICGLDGRHHGGPRPRAVSG